MTTLTIRKTWKVNDVLTNPTSIVLRDPTGSYGIRRDDTGAVIVAAGTPMNPVATGVFEYALAVDGGTTCTAWIEIVYAGETYRFEVTAVPDAADAAGDYPDCLVTARNQCAALLVQITLNPKPTYYAYGRKYSWTDYQALLGQQIEQLTKLIAQASPYEIVSRG